MLIVVTVLLVAVTVPHALEDFQYGDLYRLGINLPLGVCILAVAYGLQVTGIALLARNHSRGALLLAALGGVWCVGAIVIHGHDMLFAGPDYRHGPVSKLLELLIIALGAWCGVLGIRISQTWAHKQLEQRRPL